MTVGGQKGADHDPDADGKGTVIVVAKPEEQSAFGRNDPEDPTIRTGLRGRRSRSVQ